jgi:hypothetical protein
MKRCAAQPSKYGDREEHEYLLGQCTQLRGNILITDINNQTIAALFTGRYALPPKRADTILALLMEWHHDKHARLPKPSGHRSFGSEYYVSNFLMKLSFAMTHVSL